MDLDDGEVGRTWADLREGNHIQNTLYKKKKLFKESTEKKKEKLGKNYILECTNEEVTGMALEIYLSMFRS